MQENQGIYIDVAEIKFCKDLWHSVIQQVFLDVELLISQAAYQQDKLGFIDFQKQDEMTEILKEISDPYFAEVCTNAEVDVSHVKRAVKQMIAKADWKGQVFGSAIVFSKKTGKCLKVA